MYHSPRHGPSADRPPALHPLWVFAMCLSAPLRVHSCQRRCYCLSIVLGNGRIPMYLNVHKQMMTIIFIINSGSDDIIYPHREKNTFQKQIKSMRRALLLKLLAAIDLLLYLYFYIPRSLRSPLSFRLSTLSNFSTYDYGLRQIWDRWKMINSRRD